MGYHYRIVIIGKINFLREHRPAACAPSPETVRGCFVGTTELRSVPRSRSRISFDYDGGIARRVEVADLAKQTAPNAFGAGLNRQHAYVPTACFGKMSVTVVPRPTSL